MKIVNIKYLIISFSLTLGMTIATSAQTILDASSVMECIQICPVKRIYAMPMSGPNVPFGIQYWDHTLTDRPAANGNPAFFTEWGGNLGGIVGADDKCQRYAESFGFTGSFEALLASASLTGSDDRLTKHFNNEVRTILATDCSSNIGGPTFDGDNLKVKDLFTNSNNRANIEGSGANYIDIVLFPNGMTIPAGATVDGQESSPEIVHGYMVHLLNPPSSVIAMPDPSNTCGNWTNTTGTAWAMGQVGVAQHTYNVGALVNNTGSNQKPSYMC